MGKRNPKMLSLEEVQHLQMDTDVWVEFWEADGHGYIHCGTVYSEARWGEIALYNDDVYRMSLYNFGDYGGWRMWNGRPGEAQQKKVPWNIPVCSHAKGRSATNG